MKAARHGFSLIEVVVALAILVIIIASTLSLLASTYSSVRDSEMRDIAKNVAMYTMEYIRSRNVTSDNPLGFDPADFEDPDENKAEHYLPGLIDLWNIPLQANGHPRGSISNELKCINNNPCLPDKTYNDSPLSFYYSLQGYVSLGDFDHLSASTPSPEDANAYICPYHIHHYHNIDVFHYNGGVHTYNHLMMRFPFNSTVNNGTQPNPDAIKSFTALPGYLPMVYTTDGNKTDSSNSEYSPFYTDDASLKKRTMAYRGFRVLITIVARKKDPAATHVQYYDVKVIVLWIAGKQEHSYTLVSRVVTYGGQ